MKPAKFLKTSIVPVLILGLFLPLFLPVFIFTPPEARAQIDDDPDAWGAWGIEIPPEGMPVNLPLLEQAIQQLEAAKKLESGKSAQTNKTSQPTKIEPCGYVNFMCQIAGVFDRFATWLGNLIFEYANTFLDYTVLKNNELSASNPSGLMAGAVVGWKITRDVADMIFIFVLLWVAIATIFNLEPYTVRQLLPRLIYMALLINFSLPFANIFIQTSNSLAEYFRSQMNQKANMIAQMGINPDALRTTLDQKAESNNPTPDREQALRDLRNSLRRGYAIVDLQTGIEKVYSISYAQCETDLYGDTTICPEIGVYAHEHVRPECEPQNLNAPAEEVAACSALKAEFASKQKNLDGEWGLSFTDLLLNRTIPKLIFYPIIIFVVFAAGILLLIRVMALMFVIIVGPLVFLFHIIPATEKYWQEWWNALTKWCFFYPTFFLFLWIGTAIFGQIMQKSNQGVADAIINMIVGSCFLIGSLIISQRLGIAGAGALTRIGERGAKRLGAYAKRATYKGAVRGAGAVAKSVMETKAAQRIAATPVLRGIMKPLEKITAAKAKVDEERARKLADSAKGMPDAYFASRFKGERAGVQAAYADAAGEKDIKKIERGMKTQFGEKEGERIMDKITKQLATIRPGLEKKLGGAYESVNLKAAAMKGKSVDDPEFKKVLEEYLNELSPHQLSQQIKPEQIKDNKNVQEYLLKNGNDDIIKALTSNGEQIRALSGVFEKWANEEIKADSQVGQKIKQTTSEYVSQYGMPEDEAKKAAIFGNMHDVIEARQNQLGADNPELITWINSAPGRAVRAAWEKRTLPGPAEENQERMVERITEAAIKKEWQKQGGGAAPAAPAAPAGGGNPAPQP